MAKIEVKNLNLNGAELFDDSEGFMDELHEDSVEQLKGGMLVPATSIPTLEPESIPTFKTIPTPPIVGPWSPVIL